MGTSFFAAQFLAGPYLGRLSDRRGRIPVLIISQIGTAASFMMLVLAPSADFLLLARILDGITGGNIIVVQAYVTDISIAIAGVLLAINATAPYWIGGLLAALAFIPAMILLTRYRDSETPAEPVPPRSP